MSKYGLPGDRTLACLSTAWWPVRRSVGFVEKPCKRVGVELVDTAGAVAVDEEGWVRKLVRLFGNTDVRPAEAESVAFQRAPGGSHESAADSSDDLDSPC